MTPPHLVSPRTPADEVIRYAGGGPLVGGYMVALLGRPE